MLCNARIKAPSQPTGPICPHCGAGEMHPREHKVLIRAYKVVDKRGRDWSQCLVCAGFYQPVTFVETPQNYDSRAGWFMD